MDVKSVAVVVTSVAVYPTEKPDPPIPSSIVRHSIPKVINPEQLDFQVTILYCWLVVTLCPALNIRAAHVNLVRLP